MLDNKSCKMLAREIKALNLWVRVLNHSSKIKNSPELHIVKVRDKDYPFPSMVQLGRGENRQWYVRSVEEL